VTLPSDALSTSVPVGGGARLVYEYAPAGAMVLNPGATAVYIGTSSSLSSANGVPVAPGQSVTWSGGQLWAAQDPTLTDPGMITLTGAVSQLSTPPPAAAKYGNITLVDGYTYAAGEHQDGDVSEYAVVTIATSAPGPSVMQADLHQATTPGAAGDVVIGTYFFTCPDPALVPVWQIPVSCGSVRATNLSDVGVTLWVYAATKTNLAELALINSQGPVRKFTGTSVANNQVQYTATDGMPDSTVFSGTVQLDGVKPYSDDFTVYCQQVSPAGDTVQTVAVTSGGGDSKSAFSAQFTMPSADPAEWFFKTPEGGMYGADLTITQL